MMLARARYFLFYVLFIAPLTIFSPLAVSQVKGLPDFTDLIKSTTPAVVKINTLSTATSNRTVDPSIPPFFRDFFDQYSQPQQQRPTAGVGSGFIISKDGYIVTNHHVISGADRIIVRLSDRREYDAEVIGSDSRSDLALLKIEEENLSALKFANSKLLEVGEWVLAIGSPFDLDYSASVGIVSAIGRSLPNGSGQDYVPFIQTDVAINPGNSGGPLFNLKGEVVGINSQIFTRSGGFMGLSFAVPSEVAEDVIGQLKKSGEVSRGWLGVVIQDVDRDLAKSFGLDAPKGALVTRVQRNGPADEAGIKSGDVIVEFNGKPIEFSHDLPHVVGLVEPGSTSKARIFRERKEKTIEVKVGVLEQGGQTGRVGSNSNPDLGPDQQQKSLGLSIEQIDAALIKQLEITGGVMVTGVEASSSAAKAGLLAGDVIVQIAFKDISGVRGFKKVLEGLSPGSVVPILFYRNGTAVFRTIQVDD